MSAISEHLQLPRLAGLVKEAPCGRQRLYHLNAIALSELAQWPHPFEQYWDQRLDVLTDVLDKDTK